MQKPEELDEFDLSGSYEGSMSGPVGYLYVLRAQREDYDAPYELRAILFEKDRADQSVPDERLEEVMERCALWRLKKLLARGNVTAGGRSEYKIQIHIARDAVKGRLLGSDGD